MTKIIEHIFNKFPSNMIIKSDRSIARLKWIGEHISSPENRLIMGGTALVSQPWIDLYNKDVDDETRKASFARTAAKIIAGTITGVAIRYGTIGLVKRLAKVPEVGKQLKNIERLFTPSKIDIAKFQNNDTKVIEENYLKQYCNTVGTILGLIVMLYTNFAIDVPLTRYFTKIFSKKLDISQNNNINATKGGST